MRNTRIRLWLVLPFVLMMFAAVALAAGDADDNDPGGTVAGATGASLSERSGACRNVSLNLWGLSYHPDRTKGYNEQNWGAGVSCYSHPNIPWLLGTGRDNRLVLEGDAMINSWRGLIVPVSIGANYRVKAFAGGCKLYAVAALTAAYYSNPVTNISRVDVGPIPGVSLGCGGIRTNMMFVPSTSSKAPLAVAIASMSIVF